MYRNSFVRILFDQRTWLPRVTLTFVIALLYVFSMVSNPSLAYAEGVPGGNIANPVVRAVDIAKPSVVRIITTIGGRITVRFTPAQSVSFPLNGGSYKIKLSGSGAFITSHGDILTADHVIKPPRDQAMDQALQIMAAPDIASYINRNLNPIVPFKKEDVLGALAASFFISEARYEKPSSEVYLSTDFTGPLSATDLQSLPASMHAQVDKVEMESAIDQNDMAIIHVNMDNTPSLQLSDSSKVAQQDELTMIGFPGNADLSDPNKPVPDDLLTSSVNKLYVSALRKRANANTSVIQVGGNVEHGDSGGPVLDSNGMVVGVVSFSLSSFMSPGATSFLQTSNNAQAMIRTLGLNTTPGPLQKAWSRAFAEYASTTPGHWHKALSEFRQMAKDFPQFTAIAPYIAYTSQQAAHEPLPKPQLLSDNTTRLISIGVVVFLLIVLAVAMFVSRRKKNSSSSIEEPPVPPTLSYPSEPPLLTSAAEMLADPPSQDAPMLTPDELASRENEQAETSEEQPVHVEPVTRVEEPETMSGNAKPVEELAVKDDGAKGAGEETISNEDAVVAEELPITDALTKFVEEPSVEPRAVVEEPITEGLTEIDKNKLRIDDLVEVDVEGLSTDDEPTIPSLPVFGI